jgi:hypothetical protein
MLQNASGSTIDRVALGSKVSSLEDVSTNATGISGIGALAGLLPQPRGRTNQSTLMPSTSKNQQMAAGAALSAKRGERKKSSLKGASKEMYESMSKSQLKEFASTKRKHLPTKKKSH